MAFISKKLKAEIRARRRKKEKEAKKDRSSAVATGDGIDKEKEVEKEAIGEAPPAPKKQRTTTKTVEKRKEEEKELGPGIVGKIKKNGLIVIPIPSNLSNKDARNFRKEARRHAKKEESIKDVQFVTKEEQRQQEQEEVEQEESNKKRKRQYPRINDIITAERRSKQKSRNQTYLSSITTAEKSRYVALDCEMVGIGTAGKESALARVSLVDFDGVILLDNFVQVPMQVTDFRTRVSGVRAKDIRGGGAVGLQPCRKAVAEMIKDKILIGHALKHDFKALMMDHPPSLIRDTARYKPFMRRPNGGGKLRPRKLKQLAKEFCDLDIQVEGEAHCSVDDARAAMELYKCQRLQWERSLSGRERDGKRPLVKKKAAV